MQCVHAFLPPYLPGIVTHEQTEAYGESGENICHFLAMNNPKRYPSVMMSQARSKSLFQVALSSDLLLKSRVGSQRG